MRVALSGAGSGKMVFAVTCAALLVIAVVSSALSDDGPPRHGLTVDLGPVDRFAPGSVTTFAVKDGRVVEVTDMPRGAVLPWGIHVVRLDDRRDERSVRAFSWRSPDRGHAVWWLPDALTQPDPGFFIDSGRRSMWRYDGTRVVGAADRNLDRFPVQIDGRGHVIVDLSRIIEGDRPLDRPLRA